MAILPVLLFPDLLSLALLSLQVISRQSSSGKSTVVMGPSPSPWMSFVMIQMVPCSGVW